MRSKAGWLLLAAGAGLLAAALLLLAQNRRADAEAGEHSAEALESVEAAIAARSAPSVPEETPEPDAPEAAETPAMPTVEIGGYDYIGYLELPALGLRLPVMADWDYARLALAPCREFGSTYSGDLVIAAHNFSRHFGRLKELQPGDAVSFTDMDGVRTDYTVSRSASLAPGDVEAVAASGSALVLYTCTPGGKNRVAVFCEKADSSAFSA